MSGVNEIQSRIQAIQARVASPPVAGRFSAIFQAQLATAAAQDAPATTATPEAEGFTVNPLGSPSTAQEYGEQAVTLGMMLGISSGPSVATRPSAIATSAELTEYLEVHDITARNGRLDTAEMVSVTGAWFGTGYLLPPAATAWEEMRAAAAADGIDLQATDFYRSWESQNNAYQKHLRGEKQANVLPPGRSEHGIGLAVDITNGHIIGRNDPEHAWMRANGAAFGWHPISNETWHWEFRGLGA